MKEFYTDNSCNGWFIAYDSEYHNCPTDNLVASMLNLTTTEYKRILVERFNGINLSEPNEVYFRTKLDAQRAADWINSVMVTIKLQGVV
jgi:hypothetical protein